MEVIEQQFKNAFAYAPIGMAIISVRGKVSYANKVWLRLFEYTEEEMMDKQLIELTYQEDRAKLTIHIDQLLEEDDKGIAVEKRCIKKSGEIIWIRLNLSVVKNDDGSTRELLGLAEDITAEKKSKEQLKQSEERYRSLAENSPDLITRHDRNFRYLYASPQIYQFIGAKAEDVIGKTYREVGLPEELCVFFDKHLAIAFQTKRLNILEHEMPGWNVHSYSRLVPEFDEKGEVVSILVLTSDITERKKADVELQRLAAHLQLATESAQLGTWWYNIKTKKIGWSPLLKRMWGYDTERNDLDFNHWHGVIHPADKQMALTLLQQSYENHTPYDAEYRIIRADNEELRWIRSLGKYHHNAEGELTTLTGVSLDITSQKETEEKLRKSEERFRGTFENAAVGISHVSPEGKWLLVNQRLCEITGYSEEELLQRTFQDITFKDDINEDVDLLRHLYNGSIPNYSLEKRYIHKSGSIIWVNITVAPVRDSKGKPEYFISVIEDINERKLALEKLKLSDERFRLLNKATRDAIWDWNLFTNELIWNEAVTTVLGYRTDEVDNSINWWKERIHPDDREQVIKGIYQVINEGGSSWMDEYRFRCSDGSYKSVLDRGFVLQNHEGKSIRMLGSMQDVTERKRFEANLKEQEERFRTLANSISQLSWTANGDGWIYWYNQRWYDYTGTTFEEVQGDGWKTIVHPDHLLYTTTVLKEALDRSEPFELTFPMRRRDGFYRWFLTQAYPLKNSEGKVVQWVGTSTDIHDQKTVSEKLEILVGERTKELQRSNEDLLQFAHVTSHDLKEPVRKIKIFASRLESELQNTLSDKTKLFLQKIQHSADRMGAMIEGVLAYSTVNALEQKIDQIDLNQIIRNIESDLEVVIQQKQAIIKTTPLPSIQGAGVLIYQLFYNLINNSLKFSKPNEPPFISISAANVENGFVKIIIKDNGIGFEGEYAEKIFNAFIRLNTKDKFEGTGLGLSLCRKIVQRHGGSIRASGRKNEGATFQIMLPIKQASVIL
ncbi:PAS domain-containing sensor histidine kinase [Chryseosolibacter indicus]|uniref:histidine kinase n=1 Tax=Chryseosolibacter indicus TaxID=2782351 RepID=A0ABS5VRH0_9BACT|nr:PAS domain S-box protein [Chryseosolibacter indicus]MBT1703766.1 PAS domain S-box protein [Chryseosolibacter indicus]